MLVHCQTPKNNSFRPLWYLRAHLAKGGTKQIKLKQRCSLTRPKLQAVPCSHSECSSRWRSLGAPLLPLGVCAAPVPAAGKWNTECNFFFPSFLHEGKNPLQGSLHKNRYEPCRCHVKARGLTRISERQETPASSSAAWPFRFLAH